MKFVFTGSSSDTVTDVAKNKNGKAWAVVLILGVIVGVVALGAFIFLNRRNRRDFSHSKLVEETSPDPGNKRSWHPLNIIEIFPCCNPLYSYCLSHLFKVLRLDNSEPLDLKFVEFGHYNPGLQGDNIQMTNFPQGRSK